jgi:hypothetical protein
MVHGASLFWFDGDDRYRDETAIMLVCHAWRVLQSTVAHDASDVIVLKLSNEFTDVMPQSPYRN